VVRLPLDIQNGVLDESLFAASLSEVAFGGGREMYCNPSHFFRKTYFTQGLQTVVGRVVRGLNTGSGGKNTEEVENRVISLQPVLAAAKRTY
jgi:predicted AAA+ superfamily ATPase